MSELKNDEEFGALVFPISDNEYDALEENIFDHGCGEPIIVWDNIIIDGRKRYDICKKWELPFPVKRIDFENRYEAAAWICRNQLERGDLPDAMRKYLIGRYYKSRKDAYLSSPDSPGKHRGHQYRIAEEVGKEVYLVSGTVYKYGIYAEAIDNIASKNKNIAEKILSGKLRISQANIIELSRLPKEEVRALNNVLVENSMDRISYAEMRHELGWQHYNSSTLESAKQKRKGAVAAIKEVPAYDPDAEISSLALTIPSWISSIERTKSLADFPKTTDGAREKLRQELFALHKAVYNFQKILE
ncbi:MAG: hypothetical protein LIP11_05255 [Clostridiales bacterium]|nr:hypothetical protein [Clostridiales bacterium]